jgi:hypothetical protein
VSWPWDGVAAGFIAASGSVAARDEVVKGELRLKLGIRTRDTNTRDHFTER